MYYGTTAAQFWGKIILSKTEKVTDYEVMRRLNMEGESYLGAELKKLRRQLASLFCVEWIHG